MAIDQTRTQPKPVFIPGKINQPADKENAPTLTPQELQLKMFLRLLFFIYMGGVFLYLLPAVLPTPDFLRSFRFLNDPAFANNSTIKMGLFAALCFIAAGNVRRHLVIVEVIMVVMGLAVVSGIVLILFARNNYSVQMGGNPVSIRTLIIYSL